MRERATAAGGTIDVGPLPAGGFRVAASLPLDDQPDAVATGTPQPPARRRPDDPRPAGRRPGADPRRFRVLLEAADENIEVIGEAVTAIRPSTGQGRAPPTSS